MKVLAGIGIFIAAVLLVLGVYAAFAFFLSWGLAFAFGIQFGFMKTLVALFVVQIISSVVFSGIRVNGKRKEA